MRSSTLPHHGSLRSPCNGTPGVCRPERIDFTPKALRADMAAGKVSAARLYSAAELISHAADLCSDSAGLVHDNERRWRTFRQRVGDVLAAVQHDVTR
jgi:hypothetical protein